MEDGRYGLPFEDRFHAHGGAAAEDDGHEDPDHAGDIEIDLRSQRRVARFDLGLRNLDRNFIQGIRAAFTAVDLHDDHVDTLDGMDSIDKALRMAMMTIDRAAETSSGRATWLLPHPGSDSLPRCPIKLPRPLADKNHCEYAGYYHTDVTLPSAYFMLDVDRPEDQCVQRLDLTYLNEAAADPIDRSRTAGGRRIRAPLGPPDPVARQSKFRRAHPTTTRRGTLGD